MNYNRSNPEPQSHETTAEQRGVSSPISQPTVVPLRPPGTSKPTRKSTRPKEFKELSITDRVNGIIKQMTFDEKIAFLGGTGEIIGEKIGETLGIERIGLPAAKMTDSTLGSKLTKGATLFPSYVCQAASFDPELAYEYGKAVAEQCIADGYRVLLGPGVNIYRIPNCGRNFEYSGEDPYLASRMAVEYVKGVQGCGVVSVIKHFAANNTDYYRRNSNSVVSERALHEIYFPAFKAAVQEAGCKAVMASYNQINGIWAADNEWLISGVLRGKWGFDGFVMTDWWGINKTELLVSSGTDLEMPEPVFLKADKILPLLENGQLTEEYIDQRIANTLATFIRAGLLDIPHQDTTMRNNWPSHAHVARKIARQGLVLLKNENILPLNRSKIQKIALVGSNAEDTVATGQGAAGFDPGDDFVSYAEAIRQSAGGTVDVYSCKPEETKDADVAIVFATMLEHENTDHPFALPQEVIDLINKTAEINPNTVVVVSLGSGVEMVSWINNVKGIVYPWYPGTYGAVAFGEMLFGDLNPSGKLPFTIEKRPEDTHYFGNYTPAGVELKYDFPGWNVTRDMYDVYYREGVLVGYRWYDTKDIEPLFPFGFGLSYTSFSFSNIKLSSDTLSGDEILTITFDLTNTGDYDGAQVAQLYIQDVDSTVVRPAKELKAFKKVFLAAGQMKQVTMTIDRSALSFWNPAIRQWDVEPGEFKVLIGNSSREIELEGKFEYSMTVL